jgi:hypothetical protein
LHIEFFEEADPGADQDGIENPEDPRATVGPGREPSKKRKNRDGEQD